VYSDQIRRAIYSNFHAHHFKTFIISGLFKGIITTDPDVVFAVVHLPPNGIDRLVFSDGSDDPS
jgi:hypothetical protein